MDGQRVHADVRGLPPDRRRARRPLRAAADVRRSASASSRSASALARARAHRSRRSIAARALQGLGGAIVAPLTLTILSAAVPAERRGLALGAWGGIGGLAVALGPLVGGAVDRRPLLAVDLLDQRPDRSRTDAARAGGVWTRPTARHAASTCRGLALVSAGLLGDRLGSRPRQRPGLDEPGDRRSRSPSARVLVAAFVLWELRARAADAADALLRQPDVQPRQRGVVLHVLRDVRLDLPAGPVLPDRAGLLAAPGRAADPAVDGDADLRGADRRRAVRSHRRPADHGRRALRLQAIGLAWIAAVSTPTTPYAQLVVPVHALGHRHGALLRAGRQRRAERGAAAGGGPGLGRQQRHPRAGRRVRRRGAGVALRAGSAATRPRRRSSTGSCRPSASARRSSPSARSRR